MKRRKYNEDLDFKVVDDDGETIAVLGTERMPAVLSSTLAWQSEVTAVFTFTHHAYFLYACFTFK